MPSTVVHVALAGLIGAALLGDEFDARSIALVMAVVVVPDLDTFIGVVLVGTHRAALHTLLIPLVAGALLVYDSRRQRSVIGRYGPRGVRLAWVCVAAYALAGIGPDLFFNGANLFYPLYDQFVRISGNVLISNQRGFVQTIWETKEAAGGASIGTTKTVHYSTGVDPNPGKEPKNVERVFPIARGGLQLLLIVTSIVVVSARLWETRVRTGSRSLEE